MADVVAFLAVRSDPGVVEAGTEIVVADVGLGQQVPDDDEDGTADGHDGAFLAAAFGDAPVAFTEEGVGLAGDDSGLAQRPREVGVAA